MCTLWVEDFVQEENQLQGDVCVLVIVDMLHLPYNALRPIDSESLCYTVDCDYSKIYLTSSQSTVFGD